MPLRPGPARSGSTTRTSTSTTTCATPPCPPPGSEEQLRNLAARVFSQQLDRSKPLWELWLVEGLKDGRFAIVGKTHHCLVDGVSGVDITTVLFDLEKEPAARPSRPPSSGSPSPSRPAPQLLAEALVERVVSPREVVRGVRARAPRPAPRRAQGDRRRRAPPASFAWAGLRRARHPLQRRDRPAPPLRLGRRRLARRPEGRSRTSSAAPSTTSSSPPSPARSGATCARAATPTAGLEVRAMVPVSVRTADQEGALGNQVSSDDGPAPGLDARTRSSGCSCVSEAMGDLKELEAGDGRQR